MKLYTHKCSHNEETSGVMTVCVMLRRPLLGSLGTYGGLLPPDVSDCAIPPPPSTFLMSISIVCSVSPHFLDFKYLVMFQFFTIAICLFVLFAKYRKCTMEYKLNLQCL